jgi:hypothetical protein
METGWIHTELKDNEKTLIGLPTNLRIHLHTFVSRFDLPDGAEIDGVPIPRQQEYSAVLSHGTETVYRDYDSLEWYYERIVRSGGGGNFLVGNRTYITGPDSGVIIDAREAKRMGDSPSYSEMFPEGE